MTHVFPYLVTDLSKGQFESTLSKEVFPQIKILRRNALGTRHELRELGTRNGHTEYLWLVHAEFTGGSATGPPALSDLQKALGSLGTVTAPFASVTVDLDQRQVGIVPKLVRVTVGRPMIWSFLEVPPGYKPYVDFVSFRPDGGKLSESFEPPFQELTLGSSIVTGARATGPKGHYWYKVSLVPDRRTSKEEVIRLECDRQSWFEGQEGAGVEVGGPPARGGSA